MKKRFFFLPLLVLVLIGMTIMASCFASENFTISMQIDNPIMTVNGTEEEIDPGLGTVPVIKEGRTIVPIRAIIEAMGGTVGWEQETQTVSLNYGEDEIRLAIDSTIAYLNNKSAVLDSAPVIINGRTMLPIRFIAESFKFNVDWEQETQTVTITKTAAEDALIESPEEAESASEMNVQIGNTVFTVTLEDNAATCELVEMLREAPVSINMNDYGSFEKVGPLGRSLTTDNHQITTTAGDIVLYQGNQIVMFYGSNSWSYTKIGRIDDLTGWKEALGNGSITAVFSLAE